MKPRRLTTNEQIMRIQTVVDQIPNLKESSVDWDFIDGEQIFKIGITTTAEIYPDFIMHRESVETMTDNEIMDDLKGEMKAWDARMNGNYSLSGAPSMEESQATGTAS